MTQRLEFMLMSVYVCLNAVKKIASASSSSDLWFIECISFLIVRVQVQVQ